MSGFGNWMGAAFGGSMADSFANNWSDDQWTAFTGHGRPDDYVYQDKPDNIASPNNPDDAPTDKEAPKVDSSKFGGDVPGLLTDDTVSQGVGEALSGGKKLNWEAFTFKEMNDEQAALQPDAIGHLSDAWKKRGTTLKTESENFKKNVNKAISGHWSGASAEAAEAASHHVTETSIYDFTPASDAISGRLDELKRVFGYIQTNFPDTRNQQLIDDFDGATKSTLDKAVYDYNHKFHFDDSGHLRLSNGQYVDVQTAIDEKNRIQNSINDYNRAVQLFRDTYQPAVITVAQDFPNIPAPPDMTFGKPSGDPSGPGAGPGAGPGGGPSGLPNLGGGPDLKNTAGLKPSDLPKIPDTKIPDSKLPNTQINDPTTSTGKNGLSGLTDPLKSAMDAATGAAKDAIGQAMDAAKGAGQGLGDPNLGGPQGPPEGVLGLGPQGLGAGGGAGKGAGGVGGLGAMPKGLANATPTTAPATAAAKVPAAAAGAGLANGAGSPGAGAPAAGQRGGDQNGKGHQVNKALRRKKNGKDVIGDAEAAVPVVGAPESQGQAEGLHIDAPEQPEQPDGAAASPGPTPRRVPRPRQPMQMPGL
jgi:hypothetical protein